MKKKLIILSILILIIILPLIIYFKLSSRIKFDITSVKKNNYKIGFSNSNFCGLIEDYDEIERFLKCVNSIKYFDGSSLKVGGESPDASITILDENNKEIDEINFYGEIAIYHGKQYKIFIWEYYKLNNKYKSLNKKNK